MEELSALKKMGKRERLEILIIVVFFISGTLLDIYNKKYPIDLDLFLNLQAICRELRLLGSTLLAYKFIPFELIKLKAFVFMFCIWSSVIIIYNNIFIDSNFIPTLNTFYSVYLLWLIRIFVIKRKNDKTIFKKWKELHIYHKHNIPYNILLPVNSFRGLLQLLFIPWKNPLYETRLLVDQNKTIGVINNKFTAMEYSLEHVKNIVRKDCKIVVCKNYRKEKIYSLIGKRAILGFRDCKRLEV